MDIVGDIVAKSGGDEIMDSAGRKRRPQWGAGGAFGPDQVV
jgi:hypothetical protein